jgi:glutamate dehydrogenase (NADP+)
MDEYLNNILLSLKKQYPYQPEYLQAATEILSTLDPVVAARPELKKNKVIDRFVLPDRIIHFRVSYIDDKGEVQINNGFRIQFNSAIGPYKGGLRFHPSVNESILKFLGLEQVLKNSLTGLPMGGAKGGADFDPKGKSDREVMAFCQAFMGELSKYIGEFTDVPAGDIGVGGREIGFLYGAYRKIANRTDGVLTGKGLSFGGSLARTEATGYGLCYFTSEALKTIAHTSFKDKKVVISGSGNVAIYAAQKATELGATVIAMSDSNGVIYAKDGIDLALVKEIKEVRRGRIKEYLEKKKAEYMPLSSDIWKIPCDIALPCATQNELDLDAAKALVKNGVLAVCEGANMPCTLEAEKYLIDSKVIFGPAKAANAGGVAVSGLEMAQDSARLSWTFEDVDLRLKNIMTNIFANIYKTAVKYQNPYNLLQGANVYGFEKVADAMLAQGVI